MGKLFEEADLIFCGGGGTLLESMCVGVPAIVFAQNDAEKRHAKSLEDRNACLLSESAVWEFVKSYEYRKKISQSAQKCVDGLGTERICDVIEQQIASQKILCN